MAAIVGVLAIKLVSWLVKSDKFKVFSYYTFVLGTIVLVIAFIEFYMVEAGLPEIRAAAEKQLAGEHRSDPVSVSLTEEQFPRRDYETFSLPAGTYEALRVTLGSGAGHNWWCVAFPALCLPATTEEFTEAASAAGMTADQVELVTEDSERVRLKFRLLDWISDLFG